MTNSTLTKWREILRKIYLAVRLGGESVVLWLTKLGDNDIGTETI